MNYTKFFPAAMIAELALIVSGCATQTKFVGKLSEDMVNIPGKKFAICKYEVSQALWSAVMGENPSRFRDAHQPVEQVSWNECQVFLEKLNAMPRVKASGRAYRLPTSDEWEYACRAGATGDYCRLEGGEEITPNTLGKVAWYDANSCDKTHPVGQKAPNAFGLYDMLGNVWEWTSTDDGGLRVSCGGRWFDNADFCKAGCQGSYHPDSRESGLGLRLAY